MNLFRSILYFLFQMVWTSVLGSLCILMLVIPFKWRWKIIMAWPAGMIWGAKHILGINYIIKGRENFDPTKASIYLVKHQSAWETLFLPPFFKVSSAFVYKKELHWVPFFGWGFATLKQISIDRSLKQDAMQQVMEKGAIALKENRNVILFPEGTRIPVGQKGRYRYGGARLAEYTQTPIHPIAHNAGMLWPKNSFIKKPGTVTFSVGPAISPEGLSYTELGDKVESWIENEMRVLNPEVYANQSQ